MRVPIAICIVTRVATDADEILLIDRAGRLIDEAAASSDDTRDVATGLRVALADVIARQSAEGQRPTALWTIWAFEFHGRGRDLREHFTPWMIFGDGTANMPFLQDLPDECVGWWAEVAEVVTHPRATARLQHLLVERRHGNVGDRACRAVEAYLELTTASDLDAVEAVRTALDLALRTRRPEMVERSVRRAAELASQAVAADDPAPGVLLGFVDLLMEQDGSEHDVDSLLQQARTIYQGKPHAEDFVVARQLKRANRRQAENQKLWIERVDIWIAAGEAADPLVRVMHFQTAVEHARASGDRALVERATAKLQTMRLARLGFTSFSVETALPRGELERMLLPH